MKAYIHDLLTNGKIVQQCQKLGIEVLTPEIIEQRDATASSVDFFLDQVDVLILEATQPTRDMQFVLAQAILTHKPTLFLYRKNQPPRELLAHVKRRTAPRAIKTFSYTDSSLSRAIDNFVVRHDPDHVDHNDVVSIKFTLRLSPRMERYLDWQAKKFEISKADVLREMVAREEELDDDYQDQAKVAPSDGG